MLRRPTVPLRSFVLSLRSLQTEATRKPILLDIQGPKACITLNNAKIGNALDVDLQKELIAMITDLGQRTEVRAIVLTGTGKVDQYAVLCGLTDSSLALSFSVPG